MSGSVLSSFAAKTDPPRQVGKQGGGPMAWVGKWVLALSLTASLGLSTFSRAGTGEDAPEEVRLAFSPYRQGPPRVDGLSPGTTLTQSTWQAAVGVLPPEILRLLQAGELAITVQETTDSPLPEAYVEATLKGAGQVKLGDNGELKNYVAGLPFPLLDPSDPQAGLKAAWNLRYRNLGESVEARYTVELRDHTGATQRSLEFQHIFLYGLHRAESDANLAEWEKEGVFFKEYVHALAPLDLAGFQKTAVVNQGNRENLQVVLELMIFRRFDVHFFVIRPFEFDGASAAVAGLVPFAQTGRQMRLHVKRVRDAGR